MSTNTDSNQSQAQNQTRTQTQTQTRTQTQTIQKRIESAAESVGQSWPLHSFVTSNPLSGFENQPFHEGVKKGEKLFGGRGYPRHDTFRKAWENGQIDTEILTGKLAEHGYDDDPERLLERMKERDEESRRSSTITTGTEDEVDRVLTKWLATFLDQGNAEWSMPGRERGFYACFREMAEYDGEIPDGTELPENPIEAIENVLAEYPDEEYDEYEKIFEHHLASLPGWTSLIKRRQVSQNGDGWQSKCPITLTGYLAARLSLAD
ncbi:MAG: putative inorganic carbon transporter subunit DabA, partial [Halobacteria archaeon]|nr:putative inorganic carbon transporter subunit DabA [Halobacteria archaeon]